MGVDKLFDGKVDELIEVADRRRERAFIAAAMRGQKRSASPQSFRPPPKKQETQRKGGSPYQGPPRRYDAPGGRGRGDYNGPCRAGGRFSRNRRNYRRH